MAWGSAAQRSSVSRAGKALHAKYGPGQLTSGMLSASRNNLIKARAAKAKKHQSRHISTLRGKRSIYGATSRKRLKSKLVYRKPTSRAPKFHQRISPSVYQNKTAWQTSKTHKFKKVLHKQRPKKLKAGGYKYRSKRTGAR